MPVASRGCQAKDPSRCPHHGHRSAGPMIEAAMNDKHVSTNDRFKLKEMHERSEAEERNLKIRPVGIAVEFEDGTSEIFLGGTTDPFYSSDFQFTSPTSYYAVQGYSFGDNPSEDDWEDVQTGPLSTNDYDNEFRQAPGTKLALSEGDPEGNITHLDDRIVKRVIVL